MNRTPKKDAADFDWVKERSLCSLNQVFEILKRQLQQDAESCNALEGTRYKFSVHVPDIKTSLVVKESNRVINPKLFGSVTFSLTDKGISVLGTHDKPLFNATLTLNDDGECRLKIDSREYELWQMRKKALEDLFFED